MPGRGGSSSSRSRAFWVVSCACSVGPHLRPILRAIIWVFLGPGARICGRVVARRLPLRPHGVCACDGTARGLWGRRRRVRGSAFGALGCSSVARAVGPILGAYRIGASYFGHAARIPGEGSIVQVNTSLKSPWRRQETSLRVHTIHLPQISAQEPNVTYYLLLTT